MKRMHSKLTYANVMATLAMFIALGGASAFAASQLAKNSVGTPQLKNNSVTGAKVAPNSLTGKNIDASTLGTVPSASHAAMADSAGTAGQATHAASADTAANASHAANADTAANANQLGGAPPAAYRDSCPAGTLLRTAELCEGTTIEGHVTLNEALAECAAAGLRLPSPSEAESLATSIYAVWTDDFWTNGATSYALTYTASSHLLLASESEAEANRVCVTTPINN
jgi:hypothetical protein